MEHPLDRPVWSALTGPQAHIARGDARAWRIDPAIGLFAAARSPGDDAALAALIPDDAPLILFEDEAWSPLNGIAVAAEPMVQMVAESVDPPACDAAIVALGDVEAPAMLALATLTRPGPFLSQTHRLGGFVGIHVAGKVVAMAGTRLRVPGYVEISGVCTHPDHRGRGHGGQLMRTVAQAILAAGVQPFLHAFAHNVAAIAVYERLGFRVRRQLIVSVLTRGRAD